MLKGDACEHQGCVISGSVKIEILGFCPLEGLEPLQWVFLTNFLQGSLPVSTTIKSSSLSACG